MKKLTRNISQKYFEQCIPKIHQVRILNLLFLKFTQYLKVSLCEMLSTENKSRSKIFQAGSK